MSELIKGFENYSIDRRGEREMKVVDGNKIGIQDGVARIICGNKSKTIYKTANGDETDTFLSLNDCLKEINYYEYGGVCVVIFESVLSWRVYQFGNYCDGKWYEHGKTYGYA